MKRSSDLATPPIPPELAGEIDAAQTILKTVLLQRGGGSPDRVIAFAKWEKKVRAELIDLEDKCRRLVSDNVAAAAA